ncbi:alpha/beta hydrolase [Sphingomonas sp. BK235]|uniref:alpha/beta fold hydrolase n=1 Tax=Sphingomonas sp. BK235 TaxID=2512131 RepID=UPI0010529D22|nr:alpha/beta hydrolase [Sphingomonas sp. BK235]TCP37334.1 pimeloyl-ACP methyl ester carboxylesterase [Sphingomonas sp. BK235]
MAGFRDVYWWSADGLRLHARDYPGPAGDASPPLLCLPGLTRNVRDFEPLVAALDGRRRVLAVEFRGRGESGYAKDPMTYVPLTYAQDVVALLTQESVERVVAVGTSLGGIVTMLLAGMLPGRIAGALLNDIGPAIEPGGLARIRGYVGKPSNYPTWLHAARGLQESNADAYPGWTIERWLAMAKRLYRLNSAGRIVLDYDMRIAEPFRLPGGEAGPDLWRALAALGEAPVVVARGERSDILSEATAIRMTETLPRAERVTVPGVGHAPLLDEPVLLPAIDRLLAATAEPAR